MLRDMGNIQSEIRPYAIVALLGTAATVPSIALLCFGDTGQRAAGLCLLLFPAAILFLITKWAIAYW